MLTTTITTRDILPAAGSELPLGRREGVPAEEYHSEPALGSGHLLAAATHSVAHALARRDRQPSAAMIRGRLVHVAVLEPDTWATEYVPAERIQCRARTTSGRQCSRQSLPGATLCAQHGGDAELEALAADPDGPELVPDDLYTEVTAIAEGVADGIDRLGSPYRRLLGVATSEVTYRVRAVRREGEWMLTTDPRQPDEPDGLMVHCRLDVDAHSVGILADLKGIGHGIPETADLAGRLVGTRGWHLQAALYHDVVEVITDSPCDWAWIVHESSAPYGVALWQADHADLEAGRALYREGLDRWYAYSQTGDAWRGWPRTPTTVLLPPWAAGVER